MRMSVEAIDYCPSQRGRSAISCPVIRPPPRICVDSTSAPDACPCSIAPPIFPLREFPPPPSCPGWCVFLWFLFVLVIVVIILCLIACFRGKDDKPRKQDKPSLCQRLQYYWEQTLFCVRCGLKRIFGKIVPVTVT
ncbi:uncharacterized protein [Amphiura filiformis]|uniref:uncharacterized protein n=1 Tax=Amphiura filiformis TaxID=82378 RepID=UPI003B22038A